MTSAYSSKYGQSEELDLELNKRSYSQKDVNTYEKGTTGRHRFSQENIDRINDIIQMIYENTEGEKCLDAGSGLLLLREAKVFRQCIGLDISLEMALEKGIPKSMLLQGNCYELPFDCEEFDLVSAYSLLHHLSNIPKFLAEAYRVLKKGGYLYTDGDTNIHCIKVLRKIKMARYRLGGKGRKREYEYWRDRLTQRDGSEYHNMGLDFIELEKSLKEIGFDKVILTPRFSVNPIYNKKLSFRIMKNLFRRFHPKFCFTHIQLFAIK